MRLVRTTLAAAALACLAALASTTPAFADDRADMEAFMHDYLKAWNAHDAAAITSRYYRLEGNHPWATEAGMKAEFDRLKAQGYATSDIQGVTGCPQGKDTGVVHLRYVRLKTDGSFMPPRDRESLYRLKKFADGWRVTGFGAMPANQVFNCPPLLRPEADSRPTP